MNSKRRILITGAKGFLGKELISNLEHHVVIDMDLAGATINADLSTAIPQLLDKAYDIVIHCAGKAHMVPKTKEETEAFFKINLEGTKNLCQGLSHLTNKPQLFVLISTVSVYGLETGENIDEQTPLLGDSPYALSKIQAESYLKSWAMENNLNYLILRLPLVVGQEPPGNLGKMISAIKNGRFFKILQGKARKSMVVGSDIAKLILDNSDKSGTFHLTDGQHPSFYELEEVIIKKLNLSSSISLPYIVAKMIAIFGDVVTKFPFNSQTLNKMTKNLTFNDEKARRELGWKPTKALTKLKEINY